MYHSDFVHLHVHTQYSLLDGACRVTELLKKAADYKMPALAMTDHGNMSGAIDFYQNAIKFGVKPIIGSEVYLARGSRFDRKPVSKGGGASHLILLAKDEVGYRNLMKLVSAGYLEGFYYKPRVDKELLAEYSEGILCTSACLKGEVAWALRQNDYTGAMKSADDFLQIFGRGNFYLEMMDHGIPEQKKVNEGILKMSKELGIPVVVTNDIHYLERAQSSAHEALLCIQTQSTLDDPNRMRLTSDQFYFKSPDEMKKEFSWTPEGLKNTLEIADKCNLQLRFDQFHLPRYDCPGGMDKEEFLNQLCQEGIKEKYGQLNAEVEERLNYELKIIKKMGFVSYFLIVWDFIHYAKQKNIPVGPGRGSAAGSLVSYLLGITNLDPLKYGLLFERFLNPDRAGMPDIDIDFCYERRGEVIEYVTKKYGVSNVAQIITFGTMQARAAIRDVGRVMGVPYGDVDRIAKLIPSELGITLEDAVEKEPELDSLCKVDRSAARIMETAKVLEGLNRHASTHAAGVVISDRPLTDHVPLFKSSDNQVTTGYSMGGIAKIGLLKMDFLGLRTLTVISKTLKIIKETKNIEIDIDKIPLDDQKTYELLGKAQTFGIFQLESGGMRDLLKKSKPDNFEDIVTVLALYRPGPMGSGMLDDYIKRKRGDVDVRYDHPKLEPVLNRTYGIIVYQEQVMEMASVLAGFTMTQADHLRRAMSKKISDVMEQMRSDFIKGCQKTSNIKEDQANRLFDLIDYFSGYGFNRSHSAAYALISYQTAFLKTNYPIEFMCALLTCEKDNTEKVVEYVKECEAMGITVNPPNVNKGFAEFKVDGKNVIQYGLLAVKNVGGSAIDSMVQNRKSAPYKSIFDFCNRVDSRLVNRKVVESLIKCGAFDCFGVYRSQMMAVIEKALNRGVSSQREKASGQISFFNMEETGEGFKQEFDDLPAIKEWPKAEVLAYEKEILGYYISGHPLAHYGVEIKEFTDYSCKGLSDTIDGQEVKMVVLITGVKLTTTRKTGERMAILKTEDLEGEVEAVVFPSSYPKVSQYIKEGDVVVLIGKVSLRDEEPKLIVNDMKPIDEVYRAVTSISVDLSGVDEAELKDLKDKLSLFPGDVPVYLKLNAENYKSVEILVGKDFYVCPNRGLMDNLKNLIGEEKFSVTI